ncbi:MAG: isocitrate lyase/PEP mutase family protein [Chloroflexi bacterium]|nr:isocitrate lyase/PEP mutase family protein [Chloroflexota bacterium]MYF22086.1 isocitrate lyase/PEP mutase family protein [Chloroflexota bacterium]
MNDRAAFANLVRSGHPILAPVALDPLSARLVESLGFEAAYLSGGGFGFQLSVSEALLTITEVAGLTRQITARSDIPLIVDGGVGFGDALHTTRAVREIEAAGAAAIEIEDQVAPKRAHHHKGVEHLVPLETMVDKVREAVEARRDDDFIIIARTGAVRNESFERALERCAAYREAGADVLMLFTNDPGEIAEAGRVLGGPLSLMAPADRLDREVLAQHGFNVLIDPFTGQVAAYGAMRDAYRRIAADGSSGRDVDELMSLYREVQQMAGMDELYAIEERTTERPA